MSDETLYLTQRTLPDLVNFRLLCDVLHFSPGAVLAGEEKADAA